MPIYEYQCESCGKCSEFMQKVSDPPASECPQCHTSQLKRVISPSGFQLKGSGWYVTDFKNKEKQPKKADPPKTTSKKDE